MTKTMTKRKDPTDNQSVRSYLVAGAALIIPLIIN